MKAMEKAFQRGSRQVGSGVWLVCDPGMPLSGGSAWPTQDYIVGVLLLLVLFLIHCTVRTLNMSFYCCKFLGVQYRTVKYVVWQITGIFILYNFHLSLLFLTTSHLLLPSTRLIPFFISPSPVI